MKILVSNAGSTSLKFKLFEMDGERALCDARVERVGSRDSAIFTYKNLETGAQWRREGLSIPEYTDGVRLFLEAVTNAALSSPARSMVLFDPARPSF